VKKCNKCKIDKESNEFYKDCSTKDGHSGWCKMCTRLFRITRSLKIGETGIVRDKREIINGKLLCSWCNESKLLKDFPKSSNYKLGYYSHCKKCVNERSREKRKELGIPLKYSRTIIDDKLLCRRCKEQKPLDSFVKATTQSGYAYTCKDCNEEWRKSNKNVLKNSTLQKLYGITLQEYEDLLKMQNGVCAICGCPEIESNFGLHVDHNHETGQVRGLLCKNCNIALGITRESKEILFSMINYLEKYSKVQLKEKIKLEEVA
jgi:hypothetical protein